MLQEEKPSHQEKAQVVEGPGAVAHPGPEEGEPGQEVACPGHPEGLGDPEAGGDALYPMGPVKGVVLGGVEDVKPGDPKPHPRPKGVGRGGEAPVTAIHPRRPPPRW